VVHHFPSLQTCPPPHRLSTQCPPPPPPHPFVSLAARVAVSLAAMVKVALLALGVSIALLAPGVGPLTNSPPHILSQLLQDTRSKAKQDLPLQ
jgi:hypothetical protein